MKKCSFCAEEIQDEAKKCRFCGEWLIENRPSSTEKDSFIPNKNLFKQKEIENKRREPKKCPRCRLLNPESAQRCDCGYDFEKSSAEPEKAEIRIPPDSKEDLDTGNDIANLDDNKVRAFRAKFEAMGASELLNIRESFVPQDYMPEARKALDEVLLKRKEELDLEKRTLDEDKATTKSIEDIPKFALGKLYIYLILICTSLVAVLIALSFIDILPSVVSIGPTDIVFILLLLLILGFNFFAALGLRKRKKYALTLTFVSLTSSMLGGLSKILSSGIIETLSGGRVFLDRFIEGILITLISIGWFVYFYRRRKYFDKNKS